MATVDRDGIDPQILEGRHPGVTAIARYFQWAHLREGRLRTLSAGFAQHAEELLIELDDSPELTAGLRKLLEAKDCFVRAALD